MRFRAAEFAAVIANAILHALRAERDRARPPVLRAVRAGPARPPPRSASRLVPLLIRAVVRRPHVLLAERDLRVLYLDYPPAEIDDLNVALAAVRAHACRLNGITRDAAFQPRAAVNAEIITKYAPAMRDGAQFPLVAQQPLGIAKVVLRASRLASCPKMPVVLWPIRRVFLCLMGQWAQGAFVFRRFRFVGWSVRCKPTTEGFPVHRRLAVRRGWRSAHGGVQRSEQRCEAHRQHRSAITHSRHLLPTGCAL